MTITNVRLLYSGGMSKVAIDQLLSIDDAAEASQAAADAAQADADAAQTTANDATTDAATAQTTADGKNKTFIQASAPTADEIGDLWVDSDDDNKLYRWSGTWDSVQDGTISTAQTTADGKNKTFIQTSAPTAEGTGDVWIDSDDSNKIYRWSGSSWDDVRDATIDTFNVTVESLSQTKWSDSSGVWPANDTDDHVLTFLRQGSSIATHTIRAVFTQSSGNWTVTSHAETGDATVETITGSGGKDAKAVVSHTDSGVVGKVTLQSIDQSAAGASPSK